MTLTPMNIVVDLEIAEQPEVQPSEIAPSKTWRIDFNTGRIGGQIDGDDAIRQFIRKALTTARSRYLIYDGDYGQEITDLIGQDLTQSLMDEEIPRLVREAIEYDDRIASVSKVDVSRYGNDAVLITVTVETIEGLFITEEVAV